MRNDSIDFQNLKRMKHFSPLFQHCSKAIPIHSIDLNLPDISDIKKSFSYMVIPNPVQIEQKLFECKSLCPIFNCKGESLILTKGQNLWDFYRAKKDNQIILTEQEIWILIKQITQALIQLESFGYFHTHLKEYAIYRQSSYSYQLMFHPQMKSMLEISHSNQSFYWYDFYLSPQELQLPNVQNFVRTSKETVFSLGLLVLNVMNAEDFNRVVYSKKNYQVDWNALRAKIDSSKRKYSDRLIDLITNCLQQSPEQRYGFKEVLNDALMTINKNKSHNLDFKSKFDQLIISRLNFIGKHSSPKISDSRNKSSRIPSEKSKSPQSPSNTSNEKRKTTQASKDKQIKKFNPSPELQKKIVNSFESPPKKWKVSPVNEKKPYSIAKSNSINIFSKQKEQKNDRIKKQSVEKDKKVQKNLKKNQDVINFERGTFGAEQSSQISSFSSSKFKHDIKIQIQSNQSQSLHDSHKYPNEQQKVDKFEVERMITFGSMKSDKLLNPSNSLDSLDSQIYILDSARKNSKQKQNENSKEKSNSKENEKSKELSTEKEKSKEKEKEMKNSEKPEINTFHPVAQQLIQQDHKAKKYSLEHLKQCASILQKDITLARIKRSLEFLQKEITLQLNDCLQPIQVLQGSVSQSHGVFVHGNLYFGPFKNGRRNGFGLEVFPQNQYYFGNFRDDLFHGEGFYFWNKNQYFLGLFQNGKKVFGLLYGPKLHYFGQFFNNKKMNGFGKAKYKNGQEYLGQWTEGRRSGVGKLTEITKDNFIGNWQKGKRVGYGEHISNGYPEQGYRLKAFWKDYEIISEAIIEYSNENVYEGGMNEDLQKHGKGQFIFKKGGYFKGTFYKDNATHGQLVYKNGQKYVGSLKNMKRHGFGEYHYIDGTIKKGNWIEDIRVQKQVDLSALK